MGGKKKFVIPAKTPKVVRKASAHSLIRPFPNPANGNTNINILHVYKGNNPVILKPCPSFISQ